MAENIQSIVDNLRGLAFSATELSSISGWKPELIEDYLSIIENIILLAQSSDTSNDIVNDLDEQLTTLELLVNRSLKLHRDDIKANNEGININHIEIVSNRARIVKNGKQIISLLEDLESTKMAASKNRANINNNAINITDINELIHVESPLSLRAMK